MTQQFIPFFASRSCVAVCGGLAIGTAGGQVDHNISISNPFFQAGSLRWLWGDSIGIQSGAAGGEAICGTSFGTGHAGAANTWDAVFDVPVGASGGSAPGATVTLLTLNYTHSVSGNGSAASAWMLERTGGPTIAGETIDDIAGNVNHNATAYIGLAAGRYHFHHNQSASGTATNTPAGNNQNAATGSSWDFRFEVYTCANILSGPQSLSACAGPGGSAIFVVHTQGSSPQYQWQWRPSAAASWRDVAAENLNDSGVRAFNVGFDLGPDQINVTNPDPTACSRPEFHCRVFNNCASVTSAPAQLFIDASDVGVQGGEPGRDGLHNNNDFVAFINFFFNSDPIADLGSQGGVFGSDGQFNNNDFVVFIDQFFAGC